MPWNCPAPLPRWGRPDPEGVRGDCDPPRGSGRTPRSAPEGTQTQNLRVKLTRTLRGTTGWEWMSETPPAASPGSRESKK